MAKSENKAVREFIEKLEVSDPAKHQIVEALRLLVFQLHPQMAERMMYGGIMLSKNDEDVGGIFAYKHHVSFEFGNGYTFRDPDQLLEGKGKYRRHLKIRVLDDLEQKKVDFFVKQL